MLDNVQSGRPEGKCHRNIPPGACIHQSAG